MQGTSWASFYRYLTKNGLKVGEEISGRLAQVTGGRPLSLDHSSPPKWRLVLNELDPSIETNRRLTQAFERLSSNERKSVRKNLSKLAGFLDQNLPFLEPQHWVQAATMASPVNLVSPQQNRAPSELWARLDSLKARKLNMSWRQACKDFSETRLLLEAATEKLNVLAETVVLHTEQVFDKIDRVNDKAKEMSGLVEEANSLHENLEGAKESLASIIDSPIDSETLASYDHELYQEVLEAAKSL
jgi:DNA repair ATPase RecN